MFIFFEIIQPPLIPLLEAATEKKLTGEEITLPQTVAWASRLHVSSRYEEVGGGKQGGKQGGKKDGKDGKEGKGGDKSSADASATDDRAMSYAWMTGVVYSAIVTSGCIHLRHWLPWLQDIVFLQSVPFLCYWPECIFSFLVAVVILFFQYLLLGPTKSCFTYAWDVVVNAATNKTTTKAATNNTAAINKTATINNTTTNNTTTNAATNNTTTNNKAATINNTTTNNTTTNATTKTKAGLLLGTHSVTFLKVSDIDELLSSQGFMDGIMNDQVRNFDLFWTILFLVLIEL